jgi:energy-coupling factor transporter transmembrane protein EcfT
MLKNFVIKRIKEPSGTVVAGLVLFIILYMQTLHWVAIPIMFVFSIAVLVDLIMSIRFTISFAIFLDIENQEIILNHSLFFRKKKISLQDIKEIDTLNGNIILYSSTCLSRWQKMVCKTKNSDDYTIRLEIINAYEKIQLMNLLSDILPYSNNEK